MTMAAMNGEKVFRRKTIIIRPQEGGWKNAESRGLYRVLSRLPSNGVPFFLGVVVVVFVRKWQKRKSRIGCNTEFWRAKMHDYYQ